MGRPEADIKGRVGGRSETNTDQQKTSQNQKHSETSRDYPKSTKVNSLRRISSNLYPGSSVLQTSCCSVDSLYLNNLHL